MFASSTLLTFITLVLGIMLIPGPAVLLVITRTAQGGRKTGILTGLGIATGDFVHALCAALGLSAVLMASALAFSMVKIGGAAYLVYLGVRAFIEKSADPSLPKVAPVSPARAFWQAIPAEVLNPKTAIFFLAFLPQFVHPERGSSFLQFTVLGALFVVLSALYTTFIAISLRPLGRLVRRISWLARWQGKIIGTVFIGLGLKVATQHR